MLIFNSLSGKAQNKTTDQGKKNYDVEISNSQKNQVIVCIPFIFENRIIIPVRIKESKELKMIFDTGAPNKDVGIFVPELSDKLGLEFEKESVFGGGGSGKGVPVRIAKGEKVSIMGIGLFSERFVVLTKRRPKPFPQQDGIIGRLILDEYIVEIDFDKNMLNLYDPFTFEADRGWEAISLTMENELPIINTTIDLIHKNNIPVSLFVDIGAKVNLMIKTNPSKKIVPPKGAEEESLGAGTQGNVFGKKGLIRKLILGKFIIEDIDASFANRKPDPNFPPGCEGILGIRILKKFNLIFDYFNEVIYLKPNSNFTKLLN